MRRIDVALLSGGKWLWTVLGPDDEILASGIAPSRMAAYLRARRAIGAIP